MLAKIIILIKNFAIIWQIYLGNILLQFHTDWDKIIVAVMRRHFYIISTLFY
jgi:hypothetical protein